MQMDEGLDTGPMLLKRELDIRGKNAGQVTEELAKLGARGADRMARRSDAAGAAADDGATYAAKIDKAEARIDWTQPAERDRAAGPRLHIRAGRLVRGQWRADQAAGSCESARTRSGKPGEVLDDCLMIACGDGCDPPAAGPARRRAPMTPDELLRGFAIPKGTILP